MTLPDPEAWPTDRPLGDLRAGRLRDLLRERAEATPDATGIVDADGGGSVTYGALDRLVARLAGDLQSELGVDGGRVGLLFEGRIAFAVAFFATIRAGGSVLALNAELDAGTLASQVERADAAALVCGRETTSLAREVVPDGIPVGTLTDGALHDPADTAIVPLDDQEEAGGSLEGTEDGRDETVGTGDETVDPGDERLVMFTSGTTGEPKGVRLTAENLVASAVGSADRLGVDPDDRWLVALPTYHMGGLAPFLRSTLYGTAAVVQREFDARGTATALSEFDATGVSLVPTMLTRMLDAGWDPDDALRFVLLGGAPAPTELIDRCERRGVPVCPTYGLTETASQVATATPEEAFAHRDTVGRPIATADVTVVSTPTDRDDGSPSVDRCEPGETGEVSVDGPVVTPGYLDENRTGEAFGEYGLQTGDLGYRDAAGRLWIVGRIDDRIVTGGENVAPERVAGALREVDWIADAAVVGLPDEEWGQRVAALVVPEDDGDAVADDSDAADERLARRVRESVRNSLADYEVPKTVGIAEDLPRTPSGTVDREAVRERLADECCG